MWIEPIGPALRMKWEVEGTDWVNVMRDCVHTVFEHPASGGLWRVESMNAERGPIRLDARTTWLVEVLVQPMREVEKYWPEGRMDWRHFCRVRPLPLGMRFRLPEPGTWLSR